jgi:hypothetical protein
MDVATLKQKREQLNQSMQQSSGEGKQKLEQQVRELDEQIKQAEGEQGQQQQGNQGGTSTITRQSGTSGQGQDRQS